MASNQTQRPEKDGTARTPFLQHAAMCPAGPESCQIESFLPVRDKISGLLLTRREKGVK